MNETGSGGEVQERLRALGVRKGGSAFQDWYKGQAKRVILPRVTERGASMGVSYNQVKITSSKYQWGSCTPEGNLNFNWRLVKAPMFVIDYVIAHELAHLLEDKHTPRFWGVLRTHAAKMEKAKRWLVENGGLLEVEI